MKIEKIPSVAFPGKRGRYAPSSASAPRKRLSVASTDVVAAAAVESRPW